MAQLKDLIVNGSTRLIGPAYGTLHGDITGNADTVDGCHASDFASAAHASTAAIHMPVYIQSSAPSVSGSALWIDTGNSSVLKYTTDSGSTWTVIAAVYK